MTKFLSPLKGAKPIPVTTPAEGGGSAGAVSVVNPREEVRIDRIRQVGEEVDADEIPLETLAGDLLDLVADEAKIMKLAVGQATQFVHRVAVDAPIAVVADQVHFSISSQKLRSIDRIQELLRAT